MTKMMLTGMKNIAVPSCHADATGIRITIPSLATTTVMSATKTNRKTTTAKVTMMDTIATEFPIEDRGNRVAVMRRYRPSGE